MLVSPRAHLAAYCLFTLCRLVNSRIPGTTLKKSRGSVLRGLCTRKTDPALWPSDHQDWGGVDFSLIACKSFLLRLLYMVAQVVCSTAMHGSLFFSIHCLLSHCQCRTPEFWFIIPMDNSGFGTCL